MRNCQTIGRTITISDIEYIYVIDGEVQESQIKIVGTYDIERANRYLRRKFKDPTILVTHVLLWDTFYHMAIEKFIENADGHGEPFNRREYHNGKTCD